MKQEKLDLFYRSVLSDSYRLAHRVKKLQGKSELSFSEWLKENSVDDNRIQHLSNDNLASITAIAEKIAFGIELGKKDSNRDLSQSNLAQKQADIFNVFGATRTSRYFSIKELDTKGEPNYASEGDSTASIEELSEILEKLNDAVSKLRFTEENTASTLALLESLLSYVPTSTELSDISLFEHAKLLTGFAQAIYDFLVEQNHLDFNFKQELDINGSSFYQEEAFLLTSFDLSGIQDFIYNIVSKGAAKQLRARSFYLDMMSEYIADSLLETLGLTRANLIYLGGGHAYFLLANTPNTVKKLEEFETTFNHFLLEHFKTRLYVAFGWTPFSAAMITSSESSLKNYRSLYQVVSRQISTKKLFRYNYKSLKTLNISGKNDGRECQICHAVDNLVQVHEQLLCQVCSKLQEFSNDIDQEMYIINNDSKGLPIGPSAYLSAYTNEQQGRIYVKNNYHSSPTGSTHIFVGDYRAEKELGRYAKLSVIRTDNGVRQGIKRLAVVRMDVDDLGAAFMAGFSYQEGGRFSNFARSAMFSRSMSHFFKVYINTIASKKNLSIIYAGGDDIFAIGSWQDIITFTVELRERFRRWTNHKLSLSAGIGLYGEKTPIHLMARHSGDLEEAAKANDKDSIALFSKDFVFKFNEFISEVYTSKLPMVREFFNGQNERGQTVIYKLLELIRSDEKIDIARTAYYLASLEEMMEDKIKFNRFKSQYFEWATSDSTIRKQVECALILYIYETRKES